MAITTYTSKDKRYGIAEQTTWGTAIADGGAFQEIDCEPTEIKADVKYRETPGVHATRNMTYGDIGADEKGALPKLSLTGEAKYDELDYFLHAFFQNVSEGVSTPFSKTFTLPSTQPDLTAIAAIATAGQLLTFIERFPAASTSKMIKDVISNSLTLNIVPGERLKFTSELVGRGLTTFNSNPSGTWTRAAAQYWHWEDLDRFTINWGGGAQVCVPVGPIELAYSSDIMGVGQDGTGNVQALHTLYNREGTFTLTFNRDAQAGSAKTNWAAGTAITVNIGWGNASPGTVDGDLDITFTGKIETLEDTNEDILGTTITGRISAPDAATAPITIIMANALDRTW